MKKEYLVVTMENPALAVLPRKIIGLDLDLPNDLLGFKPNLGLMVQFSPSQARGFAHALLRKADEAEISEQ